MSASFLDDFRPITAPGLALELREAAERWFEAHDLMPNSAAILAALAELAAEQITANPDINTQADIARGLLQDIFRSWIGNSRRLGCVQIGPTVKQ